MKRFLLPVLAALAVVLLIYDIYSYRDLSLGGPSRNMNDPAVRQAMIIQQKQMVADYGNKTAVALSLSPEQTRMLVTALTDQAERTFSRQSEIMQADPARRAEIVNQMAEESKRDDAKYREAIGEGLYARIKDYQNMQMLSAEADELRVQFAATPTPLQGPQTMQLAKVIYEETVRMDAANATPPAPSASFNPASTEWRQAVVARRQVINQHVLDQAKAFLKPEQVATLKQKQDHDLEMYKARSAQNPFGRPPNMPGPPGATTNRPAAPPPAA